MSEEFTMSPKTSVSEAVQAEKTQLDHIEAKLDQALALLGALANKE